MNFRKERKIISIVLCICIMLSFASCGERNTSDGISRFVIGTSMTIDNAVAGEYNYDMLSSGASQLPLVYQDTNGEYHPLLADFKSSDALTWTYTVSDGMKWSDGEDVTAEDILFSLQYEDESGSANLKDQTDSKGNVTRAKYKAAVLSDDKKSISLTLASANVRELSNMTSFRVVPKHILENNPDPSIEDLRVSCGPYVLKEFNKNSGTLVFEINKYYPQRPNADTLVYQLFANEDTMYMALQNGDIDMIWNYSSGVNSAYLDVLESDENINIVSVSAENVPAALAFNNSSEPFCDEKLRLAVRYALDYELFRDKVGSAYADIPGEGFVPPATTGYEACASLKQDLKKAAIYMQEAGYHKNSSGKYEDENGSEFSFVLTYNSAKAAMVSCADLIKTELESFGMNVVLEGLDATAYNAKTSNKFSENNITMQAALYAYTSAGMGMLNGLGSIYVDGSHPVQGGCCVFDSEFTAARDALGAAESLDEYKSAAKAMQRYYAKHAPLIALYWDSLNYAIGAKWEGISVDNVFGLNNVQNWFGITQK